ncbi:glycosyltransferase family 2 protein [Ascidiimonas aurantiaca]|uniref:glycosyltransferase family 2 protein n=1 Tax=Ascidiimonas aurantiaca TaxID=1685432 RepID=UPI0030EEAA12
MKKKRIDEQPLVSVIMPAYNAGKFIKDSITSVRNQTYTNWELIITDDASTDTTANLVKDFCIKDPRIQLLQLPGNFGAGMARNKAIEHAQGDFIAFLDADDLWVPEKLEKQLLFMQKKNIQVSFTSYNLISEKGEPLFKTVEALPAIDIKKIKKANYIGNLTGMYSVLALGKIYMPVIRKRQDWALWLYCIQKAGKAYGLQEVLASYRIRRESVSSNKLNLLQYNYLFYRKACKFGVLKSLWYLLQFLFEHFFVKSRQVIREK